LPSTVRLDQKPAPLLRPSKAEAKKEPLPEYRGRVLAKKRSRPFDLIRDLLGGKGSGKGDHSIRGEEILRDKLRRKG
jgi:hypothetical protein